MSKPTKRMLEDVQAKIQTTKETKATGTDRLELGGKRDIDDDNLPRFLGPWDGREKIQFVCLEGTRIRGPGLQHLGRFSNLWGIYLDSTELEPNALNYLPPEKLRQLKFLHCSHANNASTTGLTDDGIRCLRQFYFLEELALRKYRQITGSGLKLLRYLRNLVDLDLSQTGVDDAGLANIANLAQLEALELSGTLITDDGLTSLRQLRKLLKYLGLNGCPNLSLKYDVLRPFWYSGNSRDKPTGIYIHPVDIPKKVAAIPSGALRARTQN